MRFLSVTSARCSGLARLPVATRGDRFGLSSDALTSWNCAWNFALSRLQPISVGFQSSEAGSSVVSVTVARPLLSYQVRSLCHLPLTSPVAECTSGPAKARRSSHANALVLGFSSVRRSRGGLQRGVRLRGDLGCPVTQRPPAPKAMEQGERGRLTRRGHQAARPPRRALRPRQHRSRCRHGSTARSPSTRPVLVATPGASPTRSLHIWPVLSARP